MFHHEYFADAHHSLMETADTSSFGVDNAALIVGTDPFRGVDSAAENVMTRIFGVYSGGASRY